MGLIGVALIHSARLVFHRLDGLTVGQANTCCVVSDAGKFYVCHEGSFLSLPSVLGSKWS